MEHVVELTVVGPTADRGPVATGLPWPRGALPDPSRLTLRDAFDRALFLQTRTLDTWPDGSARWLLIDWHPHAGAGPYKLAADEPAPSFDAARVRVERNGDALTVDTVVGRFELGTGADQFPFRS